MHQGLSTSGDPLTSASRPREERDPPPRPRSTGHEEATARLVGVAEEGVALDTDLAPDLLGAEALRRRGGEQQDQGSTTHPTRNTHHVHPTWISFVILISGASDDITEQYFSTESSMACLALVRSSPVPARCQTRWIER